MGAPRAFDFIRKKLDVAVLGGDLPRIVKRAVLHAIRKGLRRPGASAPAFSRIRAPLDLSAIVNKALARR